MQVLRGLRSPQMHSEDAGGQAQALATWVHVAGVHVRKQPEDSKVPAAPWLTSFRRAAG